jgi:hypothetical protein
MLRCLDKYRYVDDGKPHGLWNTGSVSTLPGLGALTILQILTKTTVKMLRTKVRTRLSNSQETFELLEEKKKREKLSSFLQLNPAIKVNLNKLRSQIHRSGCEHKYNI